MRINCEILNKNINFLNGKLYKKNLKLNSLQIEDKHHYNQFNFSPNINIKIKLINIDSSNKEKTDNFILQVSQKNSQIEIPFKSLNSLNNNLSNNQNTINYNKTQINHNLNFNLTKNNYMDPTLNNSTKSDNNIYFRNNLLNGLDNSNIKGKIKILYN